MNKKATIIISSLLLIAAGAYFFHFNPGSKQSGASQNTTQQSTSDKLVEIFYLPHPPAQAIVTEVEQVLAQYPDYAVTKYDFTDPENEQKMQAYGVTDHTPIAIFINGTNTFDVEGNSISLVNFPRGDAFVPTLEGTWNYEDLSKILAQTN
jgi:hypothetical protein